MDLRRVLGIALAALAGVTVLAQTDRFDRLANLPFHEGRPTPETAQILRDELLFQRATQAYLWALPLINTLGMKNASEKTFGAGYNVLPLWKERVSAKTQVTTPNSDVLYAMGYADLSQTGPLVFEAPPNLQGILMDVWQHPLPVEGMMYEGDVGLFGPDQGKGGNILILPPGYKGDVPTGYFVYRSGTFNVFIFLRAFYQDPKNLAPTVELLQTSKIYPLGGKETAKPMQFPDASGVAIDMLPRKDGGAFDDLKKLVDVEGSNLAQSDSMGLLAAIGVVKGQPFAPDAHAREILDRAAKTGYAMSRVIGFQDSVSGRSFKLFPDRHWLNPAADLTPDTKVPPFYPDFSWRRTDGGYLDLDTRIWFFTDYYSTSPGMVSMIPGKGARYMVAFTDAEGVPLSGGQSYRLNLPANIPAENFWAVTLYEAKNGSGLVNGQPFPSLGKFNKPALNPDGSTDVYLGPEAPKGHEGNWIATPKGRGYFAILRLYSPTEAAIMKRWKPGDIEKVK
jgi:hypothetical protein